MDYNNDKDKKKDAQGTTQVEEKVEKKEDGEKTQHDKAADKIGKF